MQCLLHYNQCLLTLFYTAECVCTECPDNHFGKQLGLGCLLCPENTQSPSGNTEADVCKCLPGFEKVGTQPVTEPRVFESWQLLLLELTEVPICSRCPVGMYKDWAGEPQQCVPCPEYSSTEAAGASSVAECACVPGRFRDADKCNRHVSGNTWWLVHSMSTERHIGSWLSLANRLLLQAWLQWPRHSAVLSVRRSTVQGHRWQRQMLHVSSQHYLEHSIYNKLRLCVSSWPCWPQGRPVHTVPVGHLRVGLCVRELST